MLRGFFLKLKNTTVTFENELITMQIVNSSRVVMNVIVFAISPCFVYNLCCFGFCNKLRVY